MTQHTPLKHIHNCNSKQHPWLPDASEKSNQRSQTGGVYMSSLSIRCQPTVSTPSSTVPSVPWRFLFLSLSQHSSAYPSRPTVPAHYRTSGVQLLTSYLTHVAIQFFHEPRSLTKQIWPSRLSCHSFSFLLPPPGMTPGSVAPRTIHSVRPGSTTTWPTCRDVTLSYSTFLVWTYAAPLPSSPFRSSSFRCFLVILQALSLSLPKSPSFLVTLQAKVTTTLSLSSDSPGSLCQSHHPFLSSDSPGSRCQSHYNTLHNYKSHIQRNCKPSHMQFSRWHLFSTLTTFVRDSIAYTYHMSHTALNTKVF